MCPGLDLFNHGSEAEKCSVDGLWTSNSGGGGGGGALSLVSDRRLSTTRPTSVIGGFDDGVSDRREEAGEIEEDSSEVNSDR